MDGLTDENPSEIKALLLCAWERGSLMAIKKLINNKEKYRGKFVATSSFNDKDVIAFGNDPQKVIERAEKKCDSPVMFFVPKENAIHIY